MELITVVPGVYYVLIPEHGLSVLCGCPPDVTKLLMRRGLIREIEVGGVKCESGPNAILLSDLATQNGQFCNLAEFPLLQMFYRQGMILPKHPRNDGNRPVIIGHSRGIHSLSEYVFRGTYGLADSDEIRSCGIPEEFAAEIVREKRWFAFGKIRQSEELLEFCPLDGESVEVRPGLKVRRDGVNRFTFVTDQQELTVDLNLAPGVTYEPAVRLGVTRFRREYFSVVHLGEGDGWDTNRPCLGSLLQFQGRLYLIDAGPNIMASLTAVGVSVNEIEGVFQTHGHDDHFAGLPTLARTDRKIKYYATKLVRSSIMKKMAALMGVSERSFSGTFEYHDLRIDEWNDVEGLSVMPVWSPHPVETNLFFFRAAWQGGSKSYAHLADIAATSVLKPMLLEDPTANGYSRQLYQDFCQKLREPADLKKIDIGGGMIHGDAEDFANDTSGKMVLAHTARELTPREKEIGTEAAFGVHDVLIPARQDYRIRLAETYLRAYFPDAPDYELGLLLNGNLVEHSLGTVLQRKREPFEQVLLVVTGVAEAVDAASGALTLLSAGTLIGELSVLTGHDAHLTWRAKSFVTVLEIPREVFVIFARRNTDIEELKRVSRVTLFLQATEMFGESLSSIRQMGLARTAKALDIKAGTLLEEVVDFSLPFLFVLETGTLELSFEDEVFETLGPGGVCGEESLFFRGKGNVTVRAREDSRGLVLSGQEIRRIPIVEWKVLELYERRLASFGLAGLS